MLQLAEGMAQRRLGQAQGLGGSSYRPFPVDFAHDLQMLTFQHD
jgi:hypothetical protein